MLTLLGSLLGFFGSTLPDIFKLIRDRSDKKHELAVMALQMQATREGNQAKLDAIETEAFNNRVSREYDAIKGASKFFVNLNASVRPVITYFIFFLYAGVKVAIIYGGYSDKIWGEEDSAMLAGVFSFYFGQRGMAKLNGSR
jgi:hypothetical protein